MHILILNKWQGLLYLGFWSIVISYQQKFLFGTTSEDVNFLWNFQIRRKVRMFIILNLIENLWNLVSCSQRPQNNTGSDNVHYFWKLIKAVGFLLLCDCCILDASMFQKKVQRTNSHWISSSGYMVYDVMFQWLCQQ